MEDWVDRERHVARLKDDRTYDIAVIGGGATGAGVALDAASRGLAVALVERDDFSAGTSSRSTKLIHGGVRYLEKAVKEFDRSQFNLVRDALRERAILIDIAPHLAYPLELVTPLYNWLEVPYYMTGLKLYDWLAGKANLRSSTYVDAKRALDRFPMLKQEGLRGGVVYYDGQFDDARMNVAIALTAAEQGAHIANHVAVVGLAKENGKVNGIQVEDGLTGASWTIHAKVVVNATGPFTDAIRRMDDPNATPMLETSSGAHIILNGSYSPPDTGLLIPETEDGRVLFLLPWLGHTLVGTTDNPAEITEYPKATEEEVEYILRHIRKYFDVPVERSDVRATWSGLRPLVRDPDAADTAGLSRDHVINVSESNLLTVAGGKWTTYRKMALDVVDHAQALGDLGGDEETATDELVLIGGREFESPAAGALQEAYGLDAETASYLNRAYGDRAGRVADLIDEGFGDRLAQDHLYLEAEVVYAARAEFARTTTDVLTRRTRLGFLDRDAAVAAVPRVSELLSQELGWSTEALAEDRADATANLV